MDQLTECISVHQPHEIEECIIQRNANTNKIFYLYIHMLSRSSRPKFCSIGKWFFFGDKVDGARMYSTINHYWQEAERVFIWQQCTKPHWQNCWRAQKPDSCIASRVQSSALRQELGSFYPQLIGLTGKIGTEEESDRSGEEKTKSTCFWKFNSMPVSCNSKRINHRTILRVNKYRKTCQPNVKSGGSFP